MDKKDVTDAIKKIRESSKKRNFVQNFDLVINLKDLNLKKAEHQVDTYAALHYPVGKGVKVAAFIGPEMSSQKDAVDLAITQEDFSKYTGKKDLKNLAKSYDYFIAQATLMPKVATEFGKVLGPRGKMPNPKAGCVVPPNANLRQVKERLQKLTRISAKTVPIVQCVVGNEQSKDEEITDNVMTIYNHLLHALPNEAHNIKNAYLKLTMGKPVQIGKEGEENKAAAKKAIKKPKKELEEKHEEEIAEEETEEKETKAKKPAKKSEK